MNTTEHSTKDEIITASMEFIDHVERTTFTQRQAFALAAIALVVGFIAG